MTRTRLSALFVTIWFTGLIPGNVFLPNLGISVWQIPEIKAKNGTNVSITCQIEADSSVQKIMVKWLLDNQTVLSESFNIAHNPSSASKFVSINATLFLMSMDLNKNGIYYCKAHTNLPILGPCADGNGTHVYVVYNSTTVTTPTPTLVTWTFSLNSYNTDTVMWSVLSGMGFVLLIICIACVIHTHHKGHCSIEPRAKEALVDVTHTSPSPDTRETVVYAALNIPRDSVKSRNENRPAPTLTSVTSTEESVTYSEVHLKKGPKDEG